jgi:hypothetical protein
MPIIKSKQVIDDQEVYIYIEVDHEPKRQAPKRGAMRGGGSGKAAAKRVIETAEDLFGDGLELAKNCAAKVVDSIDSMNEKIRPEQVEVQLAIKLDSEVGAVLVKASAGAQMQITLKWSPGKS